MSIITVIQEYIIGSRMQFSLFSSKYCFDNARISNFLFKETIKENRLMERGDLIYVESFHLRLYPYSTQQWHDSNEPNILMGQRSVGYDNLANHLLFFDKTE
jgi:hypothetical protein